MYRISIFVHVRDITDRQALVPGSKVSYVYEADEKGGKAKEVAIEEMAETVVLDEGPREMGKVKVGFTASPDLGPHLKKNYGIRCLSNNVCKAKANAFLLDSGGMQTKVSAS